MSKEKFDHIMQNNIGKNVTIGEALLTEIDINKSKNYLDVLLRKLLVRNKITKTQFNDAIVEYNDQVGTHPARTSNTIGNLRKSIHIGNISFKKFLETLRIFNYRITNMKISLINPDGEEYDITLK